MLKWSLLYFSVVSLGDTECLPSLPGVSAHQYNPSGALSLSSVMSEPLLIAGTAVLESPWSCCCAGCCCWQLSPELMLWAESAPGSCSSGLFWAMQGMVTLSLCCSELSRKELTQSARTGFSLPGCKNGWKQTAESGGKVEKSLGPTKNELQEAAEGSSSSLTHPYYLFTLIPFHSTLGLRLSAMIDMNNF